MKLNLFLVGAALLCMQCGRSSHSSAIDASRDSINALMERNQIPGLAVTVMVNGQMVWSEGFGHADVEQDVHVDPATTRFRIGSISKSLTAFGLARLYEQHKIFLDSSIYFYLPDYPFKGYRPSIRQIAGHIAGVRHYRGDEWLSARAFASVTEGLSIFKNDSLMFAPGSDYSYSSYGFNLLSAAMEKASGRNFLDFMNAEVFIPLKLANTCPDLNDSIIYNRSRFYEVDSDHWTNAPYVDNSYKWAGGGFISTSEDIARFGNALLANDLVSAETIRLFTTPQSLNNGTLTQYGIGFATRQDHLGRYFFGHSGGSVGGSSDMVIYPEEKVVVAVLTNLSDAGVSRIAKVIAHLVMKE